MHLKSHVATVHSNNLTSIACPLCQEPFSEKSKIQKHLTAVHNVNSEGLTKLLALVEEPKSKMPPTTFRETPLPMGNIALAKVCEVNLEYLDLESSKLAAEDGELHFNPCLTSFLRIFKYNFCLESKNHNLYNIE